MMIDLADTFGRFLIWCGFSIWYLNYRCDALCRVGRAHRSSHLKDLVGTAHPTAREIGSRNTNTLLETARGTRQLDEHRYKIIS
jgi:hypothetical protein